MYTTDITLLMTQKFQYVYDKCVGFLKAKESRIYGAITPNKVLANHVS